MVHFRKVRRFFMPGLPLLMKDLPGISSKTLSRKTKNLVISSEVSLAYVYSIRVSIFSFFPTRVIFFAALDYLFRCCLIWFMCLTRMSNLSTTPILQRKKNAAPKPPVLLNPTNYSITHVNNNDPEKSENPSGTDIENKNNGDSNNICCSSHSEVLIHHSHHESLPQIISSSTTNCTELTTINHSQKLSLPSQMITPPTIHESKLNKDLPPKRPPPPDANSKSNNSTLELDTDNVTVM